MKTSPAGILILKFNCHVCEEMLLQSRKYLAESFYTCHVYVIFLEIHTIAPLYVELEAYIWPLLWALPPFPPY